MTLHIDFDPLTEARLAAAAKRQGVAAPEIIKKLVQDYLPPVEANEETGDFGGKTFGDMFGDLIGTIDGLPSDLSTNPKYMEGFGETKSLQPFKKP